MAQQTTTTPSILTDGFFFCLDCCCCGSSHQAINQKEKEKLTPLLLLVLFVLFAWPRQKRRRHEFPLCCSCCLTASEPCQSLFLFLLLLALFCVSCVAVVVVVVPTISSNPSLSNSNKTPCFSFAVFCSPPATLSCLLGCLCKSNRHGEGSSGACLPAAWRCRCLWLCSRCASDKVRFAAVRRVKSCCTSEGSLAANEWPVCGVRGCVCIVRSVCVWNV